MNRTIEYNIQENMNQYTIECFLREHGYSRHLLTHLKKTPESILVNGTWERVSFRLQAGDQLLIHYSEEASSENIIARPLPLHIIYEDEDLLIVNKPADMPVHPSQGNYENTLANGLACYFEQQEQHFVFRCINRLDRDTTGLLLVAKNGISGCILSDMMKNRQISRTYCAIVTGYTPPEGTINAPLCRTEASTIERCVSFSEGESAVTHYRTLAYKNGYSLISIKLETGRTHQIRVHMKHIGHPLPGDFLYNPDYSIIKRQALHSSSLEFNHPISGELLQFHAGLPEDFKFFK